MANPYWNFINKLARQTLARADAVNALFEGVEAGFAKIPDITEVNRGSLNYAQDTGIPNEVSIAVNPTITSYQNGDTYTIRKNGSNTGPCTVSVNGIGQVPLRTMYGAALAQSDLLDGSIFTATYAEGVFRIQGFTATGIANVEANKLAAQAAATQSANSASAAASSASSASSSASAANTARILAQQAAATAQAIAGGSYTAAQITYAPGDAISSTTVQGAIGEVNDDVQALAATVSANQSTLSAAISGLDSRIDALEVEPEAISSDYLTFTRRTPNTTQTYSSPGVTVWNKPANLDYIEVEVWGGGGAGGGGNPGLGSSAPMTFGGSGGGGGYTTKRISAADLASTVNITVGAGGVGSNATAPGGNGGSSSFGSHCSAAGGTGGSQINGTARTMGTGGTSTGGDLNLSGSDGLFPRDGGNAPPYNFSNIEKAAFALLKKIFGCSQEGATGGRDGASPTANHDGVVGPAPGGGGTSGVANNTAQAGGNGGAGRVIVRAYLIA